MPVIVTVKVEEVFEVHDSTAVPEPVIVLGLIPLHTRPAGTVSVSVTVPVKPPVAVIVIVELASIPTVAEGEVAAIVKSWTAVNVKVAVAE